MYKLRGIEYDGNLPLSQVIEDLQKKGEFENVGDTFNKLPEKVGISAQEIIEGC